MQEISHKKGYLNNGTYGTSQISINPQSCFKQIGFSRSEGRLA